MESKWLDLARRRFNFEPDDLIASVATLERLATNWRIDLHDFIGGPTRSLAVAGERIGEDVVLKVPVFGEEKTSGFRAAVAFDGHGGVPILEGDEETGSLLMVRLMGPDLSGFPHDEATEIWIDLVRRLSSAPEVEGLPLADYLPMPDEPRRTFSEAEHERICTIRSHLLDESSGISFTPPLAPKKDHSAEGKPDRLTHGDLHHFNILQHEGAWYAIDPKGLIADPHHEASAMLRNPFKVLATEPDLRGLLGKRIGRIAEALQLEPDRIREWGIVQTYDCIGDGDDEWGEVMIQVVRALTQPLH